MRKLTAVLLVIAMYQHGYCQTWSTGTSMPEPVRAGNTATYSANGENYLFVVSGRNANGVINNKNYRYQVSTDSWSEMANHPTGILSCGTAILKDSLYTIGGVVTTPGPYTKKVYKYSINENTWTTVADFPVTITDTEAVAYQDSLIYVVGGYNTGKVRVYNSRKNTWRNATSMMPGNQTISWGSLAVRNDTLVYMCGATYFLSPNYSNTVRIGVIDQNDRSHITWSLASPFPGQTRTFFDTYPWQQGLIVTGGSTNNTFQTSSDECYYYEVGADRWTQLPSKPTPWNTGNSGSFLIGDQWKLVCTAGYNNAYIDPTEIFSAPLLSDTDFENENSCNWKNFNVYHSAIPKINFCSVNPQPLKITITDMTGASVVRIPAKIYPSGENTLNELAPLATGIYLCMVSDASQTVTQKLIIQ